MMVKDFFKKLFSGGELHYKRMDSFLGPSDLRNCLKILNDIPHGVNANTFIAGGAVQKALHGQFQETGDIDIFCGDRDDFLWLASAFNATDITTSANNVVARLDFDGDHRSVQLIRSYSRSSGAYPSMFPTGYGIKPILKSFDITCCQLALRPSVKRSGCWLFYISDKQYKNTKNFQASINWGIVNKVPIKDQNIVTRYYKYLQQGYTFPDKDKKKIHKLMAEGQLPDLSLTNDCTNHVNEPQFLPVNK